jgi:hypothetical protein
MDGDEIARARNMVSSASVPSTNDEPLPSDPMELSSSACVEGITSTASPFVAVMDANHQRDERIIHRMYRILMSSDLDLVVGKLVLGWFSFNLVCGIEALANVSVGNWLYSQNSE